MVESLRNIIKDKIDNCVNNEEKERLMIIDRILIDDDCFSKMKTDTAYKLLIDIGYTIEEAKDIYNLIIFN